MAELSRIEVRVEMLGELQLESIFNNVEQVPEDFSPVFHQMIDDFFENNKETFDSEGPGWEPLKPSTIRDRKSKGFPAGPILVRTGKLRASLTERGADGQVLDVRKDQFTVGTSVRYAMYHQTGSIKVANHPPKRSPVVIRPALQGQWNRRLVNWLREEFDYRG